MSYGIVMCSTCSHELHQDGPADGANGWQHCDTKTPKCAGAAVVYVDSTDLIEGEWCGRDAGPSTETLPGYRLRGRSTLATALLGSFDEIGPSHQREFIVRYDSPEPVMTLLPAMGAAYPRPVRRVPGAALVRGQPILAPLPKGKPKHINRPPGWKKRRRAS